MIDYDIASAKKIIELLEKNPRGMTIKEISDNLKLNRHTVTKILERLLIEKRVDYDAKGPAKIFYITGKPRLAGRIDISDVEKIWIDIVEPIDEKYGEKFIRLNQTKPDFLTRSSSKFRSVGAISVKKNQLINLIRLLRDIAKNEFGIEI